jgi:hypothetical protein
MLLKLTAENEDGETMPQAELDETAAMITTLLSALVTHAAQGEVLPVFKSWAISMMKETGTIEKGWLDWFAALEASHLASISLALARGSGEPESYDLIGVWV